MNANHFSVSRMRLNPSGYSEKSGSDLDFLGGDATLRTITHQDLSGKGTGHLCIKGPSRKSADVVTVWIILFGGDVPQFVTAFPGEMT